MDNIIVYLEKINFYLEKVILPQISTIKILEYILVKNLMNIYIDPTNLTESATTIIYGNKSFEKDALTDSWEIMMLWVMQRQCNLNRNKPPFMWAGFRMLEPWGIYFDSIFNLCKFCDNYGSDFKINIPQENWLEWAELIGKELYWNIMCSLYFDKWNELKSMALFLANTSKKKISEAMLEELEQLNQGKNPYNPSFPNFYNLIEICLHIERRRSPKLSKMEFNTVWTKYKKSYEFIAKKLPKDNRIFVYVAKDEKIYECSTGRSTNLLFPKAPKPLLRRSQKSD